MRHPSPPHRTNKRVSPSQVWLTWLKIGRALVLPLLLCSALLWAAPITIMPHWALPLRFHCVVPEIQHAVGFGTLEFAPLFVSYLHTEWWCYRGCRSWHRGRSRCREDRGRTWRSPGSGWTSLAYRGNTLRCRRLLVEGSDRKRMKKEDKYMIKCTDKMSVEHREEREVAPDLLFEHFSAEQASPLWSPSGLRLSSSTGCWCQISGSPRIHKISCVVSQAVWQSRRRGSENWSNGLRKEICHLQMTLRNQFHCNVVISTCLLTELLKENVQDVWVCLQKDIHKTCAENNCCKVSNQLGKFRVDIYFDPVRWGDWKRWKLN